MRLFQPALDKTILAKTLEVLYFFPSLFFHHLVTLSYSLS